MTSAIEPGAIDEAFPVAGQDNDSQGFRDNFSAIQTSLAAAKLEIEELQTKAVLIQTIGDTTTVANDLGGSVISNGVYSQLNGTVPSDGLITVTDGSQDVDLNLGPLQIFKIQGGNAVLRFTNWAGSDVVQYSVVRVHLVSDGNARSVTLASESAGTVVFETGSSWGTGINLNSNGLTHTVFEAWSYDGNVVFVRDLGNFLTPA